MCAPAFRLRENGYCTVAIVRCEHLVVEYTREQMDIDGRDVIAHKFPCTQCDASVLIWDDEVNYEDIE